MDSDEPLKDSENSTRDVFLLTKSPKSDRSKICMRLMALSENSILYLAGDGVYNLLDDAVKALPRERILACREDLLARGVQPGMIAVIPNDFYERLIGDIMFDGSKIYAF